MGSDDARIVRAVGDYFRRARGTLGWTLSDVVDRAAKEGARFSVANLSRFERGIAEFSLMDAYAIARALGTPLNYLEEVIRAAKTRVDVDVTGKSFEKLMESGKRYAKLGESARAAALFEAAHDKLLLDDKSPDRDEKLAEVLVWAADSHARLRHFAMAADLAAHALDLTGASPDRHALALLNLVHVYCITGRYQRARIYAARVKEGWEQLSTQIRAIANAQFGTVELNEKKWTAAVPYFERASEDFVAEEDVANLLLCRTNLGYCLGRSGRRDEGIRLLTFVVDQAAERGMKGIAAAALQFAGRLLSDAGRFDEARDRLESAASISRSLGHSDGLFAAWFLIWRLEQKAGRPERERAARQVLTRLLRKADPRLPEVEEFVAQQSPSRRSR